VDIVNFQSEKYQLSQVPDPASTRGASIYVVQADGETLAYLVELLGGQLEDETELLQLNGHLELEGDEDPWTVPLPQGAEIVLPEGVVLPISAAE
jgi:hypothetical protein